MKSIISGMAILLALTATGLAADAEGKITKFDKSAMTLTLDNGNTYKLSEEFSSEDYEVGMSVMISYDEINGEKIVLQIIPD